MPEVIANNWVCCRYGGLLITLEVIAHILRIRYCCHRGLLLMPGLLLTSNDIDDAGSYHGYKGLLQIRGLLLIPGIIAVIEVAKVVLDIESYHRYRRLLLTLEAVDVDCCRRYRGLLQIPGPPSPVYRAAEANS